MKKIFSAFVIAVCCMFMAMPAQAQLLKWGVKGGVNMTKIDWDGGYKGNKDNSTGFFIGPMAEFTIPIVGLGVDGALLFSQRGKDEVKQTGLEVPVNLKSVSYTHLRAHETGRNLVCRLLLEKKKIKQTEKKTPHPKTKERDPHKRQS